MPGAPAIRLDNLRRYLEERAAAPALAVGEAAGYQGMRWSGIAFTSERDLARWGLPYRGTSIGRPRGWSEPSGTIVHKLLDQLGAERAVVLWNTVPAHPFFPGRPLSNRRPTAEEIGEAVVFLLSERASIITGQVIHLDGGLFARAPWPTNAAEYVPPPPR